MTNLTKNLPNASNILRKQLKNGATVLAWHNPTSPAVVVQGLLAPGTIADTHGKFGLANLTAAMLMTGTQKHDFQALHEKIESLGASINIQAGKLATSFSLQCLSEDLPSILDLLVEVLSQPSFPENHFNRIKTQILTSIAIRAQDTSAMAGEAFDRAFYGSHPYAIPSIGYAQDIAGIELEHLKAFHADFFAPHTALFTVSGGLAPDRVADMLENSFGAWQKTTFKTQPDLPDFIAPQKALRQHVAMAEKSQTDLIIGVLAPKTQSEDIYAAMIGNNILGQFGMMGRVGDSVREKAGLAYYVQSALGSGLGPTPWQVFAGVNPDNLDKAISLIKDELKRFANETVSTQELEDSRAQMIGRQPLALETNVGITRALLSIERYQLGLNHLLELPDKLAAISKQDILDVAHKYWGLDRLTITSAGRELA